MQEHTDPLIAEILKQLKHEDAEDDVKTWNNETWNAAIKTAVKVVQKYVEANYHEQRSS